jgi:hypothetical protein
MPAARNWTEAEDNHLREIAGKVPAERLGMKFGCCRQTVIERERLLGIVRCVRRPKGHAEVKRTRSKYYEAMNYVRDEFPLRAGHPETWNLINRGTVLDGMPWPLVERV